MKAFSYDWWQFVALVNGKVVFNDYNYSNATCKHQSKVRGMLHTLGINIDITVSCSKGLQSKEAMDSIIAALNYDIKDLETKIAAPRSQKAKNVERKEAIESLKAKLFSVLALYKSPLEAAISKDLSL